MKTFLKKLIQVYQNILSPFLGCNCRFHPTCSNYAKQALEQKGVVVGSFKTLIRLIKCNPLHRGGYDPVHTTEKPHG